MTSKHSVVVLLTLVLLNPLAQAQTPSSPEQAAQEAELKKARIARDRKALALVEEIIKETESLKLPENRIRIQIALADLLWQRDEPRAVSFFKDAAAGLGELTAALNVEHPDYNLVQLPSQMRGEILAVVARHDARLALDFLRSTRPAAPQPGSVQPDVEAQMEMRLASGIAGKDVNEALRIAEESLKKGIDYEAINLLQRLASPDKAPADRLLTSMLGRLRSEDFSKNPGAWYVALTLLRIWSENNRIPAQGQRTTYNISLPRLNEQAARELSSSVIAAVMNDGVGGSPQLYLFSGGGSGNLQQIKMLMPDIERLSPNQAAALGRKIAEFDKINELQGGPWGKYQELIQNGTPDDLVQASKIAPGGIAGHLIQQAAGKALSQGDPEAARKLASTIEDPRQRNETSLNIDRQSAYQLGEQGSFAEARAVLSRIPLVEERAGLLAQLALRALERKGRAAAIQLLGEARALLGERSQNYQQLRAQLQIARGYAQFDSGKSISIIETAIEQLNDLAAAALILNGFDLQQYFREGEFVFSGNNPLCVVAREVAGELTAMSLQDFDRARSAAGRFARPELRAMTLLQIVQSSLLLEAPQQSEER